MRYTVVSFVLFYDEENNVTSEHSHRFNFNDEKQARECYENYVYDAIELHTINPDECDWKVALYDDNKDDYVACTKSRYYGKFV